MANPLERSEKESQINNLRPERPTPSSISNLATFAWRCQWWKFGENRSGRSWYYGV